MPVSFVLQEAIHLHQAGKIQPSSGGVVVETVLKASQSAPLLVHGFRSKPHTPGGGAMVPTVPPRACLLGLLGPHSWQLVFSKLLRRIVVEVSFMYKFC